VPKDRSKTAPRTARPALDRATLVKAALRLVDEQGLDALSFSNLARQLGVTAPALYWHVRNRDELLAAMVDHAFADLHPPEARGEDWQADARTLYGWFRERLLARPGVFGTTTFGILLPYRFIEIGVAGSNILLRSGLRGAELVRASRALFWHTYGFALFETALRGTSADALPGIVIERAVGSLAREDLARVLGNLGQLTDYDPGEVFTYSLDLLLRGIAQDGEQARQGATQPQPRRGARTRAARRGTKR
jgi:TetR/AcrR family tetracycline transcriptional repressor